MQSTYKKKAFSLFSCQDQRLRLKLYMHLKRETHLHQRYKQKIKIKKSCETKKTDISGIAVKEISNDAFLAFLQNINAH